MIVQTTGTLPFSSPTFGFRSSTRWAVSNAASFSHFGLRFPHCNSHFHHDVLLFSPGRILARSWIGHMKKSGFSVSLTTNLTSVVWIYLPVSEQWMLCWLKPLTEQNWAHFGRIEENCWTRPMSAVWWPSYPHINLFPTEQSYLPNWNFTVIRDVTGTRVPHFWQQNLVCFEIPVILSS